MTFSMYLKIVHSGKLNLGKILFVEREMKNILHGISKSEKMLT